MKEQREEEHYITIKRSIDQENIAIPNMHAPKHMEYTKPKLIELNEKRNRQIHTYIWEPHHPTPSNLYN